MLQLSEIFDFTDSRHVETVLELADFDLLDGDRTTRDRMSPYVDKLRDKSCRVITSFYLYRLRRTFLLQLWPPTTCDIFSKPNTYKRDRSRTFIQERMVFSLSSITRDLRCGRQRLRRRLWWSWSAPSGRRSRENYRFKFAASPVSLSPLQPSTPDFGHT